MKNIHSAIKTFQYLSCVLIVSMAFYACQDKELGAPLVKQVRLLDPATKDSTFTQAYPGTLIAIQGENLSNATQVLFNDQEAAFNPVYNTNQTLIVSIPGDAPTEATVATVSNTLKIVTTHGETSFAFTLIPPPPVISSISNENALPGSTLTIKGSNFYLVEKITFPGNISVTNFTASEKGDVITVGVPANVSTSGPLTITTKYGSTKTASDVFLSTGAGVICNFDDVNTLEWGCAASDDATKFPGGRGKFALMEFGALTAGDGGWWNENRSINTTVNQLIPEASMNDGLSNYSLKFEIYIKEEWTAGSLIILRGYDWTYTARYAPWSNGDPATPKVYTLTAGWQTVTIPLTEFKKTKDNVYASGDPATSLSQLLGGSSGKSSLHFFFVNDGTTATKKFSAAVDNIRIVKNNP
jgi:hypothetical protein